MQIAGLAGFLLAKAAAARGRQKPKDWYDIAFVLLHNDEGGPEPAAQRVLEAFGDEIRGPTLTNLLELRANFGGETAQGPRAYAEQMLFDHSGLIAAQLRADAMLAVQLFCRLVLGE